MAYSDVLLKGRIGYNQFGWPLIIMERAKSDKPMTPVMCEVFGVAHECGSLYLQDIRLETDRPKWECEVISQGFELGKYYFKGALI